MTDSKVFKFRSRFINNTDDDGMVDAETVVQLKYLSNFWRNLFKNS